MSGWLLPQNVWKKYLLKCQKHSRFNWKSKQANTATKIEQPASQFFYQTIWKELQTQVRRRIEQRVARAKTVSTNLQQAAQSSPTLLQVPKHWMLLLIHFKPLQRCEEARKMRRRLRERSLRCFQLIVTLAMNVFHMPPSSIYLGQP